MSKADVIDSLMQSATRVFAQAGYGGTSLRDVAAKAGVPLSSIHSYFGSKESLYNEVCRRAWGTLTDERRDLLLRAAANSPDGIPSMRDIVHALAYPVVKRTLGAGGDDCDTVRIIRQAALQFEVPVETGKIKGPDDSRIYFLRCIARIYPNFLWLEIVWVYSYIMGIIYSWQVTDRLYDNLTLAAGPPQVPKIGNSAERITRSIVEFCCAGVENLYIKQPLKCDIAEFTSHAA